MKKWIAIILATLLCANLGVCGAEQAEPEAEEAPVLEEMQKQPEETEEDLARKQV